MSIIVAFYWNGSGKKYISYMGLNSEDYSVVLSPQIKKLGQENFQAFKIKSEEIIKLFFDELYELYNEKNRKIIIEYKIVCENESKYRSGDKSKIILKLFLKFLNDYSVKTNFYITKAECQFRTKLSGESLKKFKEKLKDMNLINNDSYEFEWHMWSLILHATKSRCIEKLEKMEKIRRTLTASKDIVKPRSILYKHG